MLYFIFICFLMICLILFVLLKKIYIKTATMAVIMAFGIVTRGVLLNYFGMKFFHGFYGKVLCFFIFSLWSAFFISFVIVFLDGKFKEIHYTNKLNRFGIGTWVAGTSICGILIYKEFIQYKIISEAFIYLNIVLWAIYIVICLKAFAEIFRTNKTLNVHGIILLTTVGTQSIVLLMNTVFNHLPQFINLPFILIGFSFYIVSVWVILQRYTKGSWSIEEDWNNTNCILHGAMSISGIACFVSGSINISIISFIWIAAFILFLIVESIEVYRLFRRVKLYGFKAGIFIYDVTQWSRIFTFAMFYTFTFRLKNDLLFVSSVRDAILTVGVWVVISLLLIEIFLSLRSFIQNTVKPSNEFRRKNDVTSSI